MTKASCSTLCITWLQALKEDSYCLPFLLLPKRSCCLALCICYKVFTACHTWLNLAVIKT